LPGPERSLARSEERARLAAILREAGAMALKTFRGSTLKSWIKGHNSPVSEADIAVNELLHERLPGPGDGWLSEESEHDPTRTTASRVWVVDPIDGTRAYIEGREDWSISVALVEQGRPVVAALYAPVTDELFLATAGEGAERNGVPISASSRPGLKGASVAGPKRMLETIAARHPEIVVVPRIYSLALRMARVATGEVDAAIAGGNAHDWDLAAADLLVHEAGGVMSAVDGTPLIYNRVQPVHSVLVAAGRECHAALIAVVRAQAGMRA